MPSIWSILLRAIRRHALVVTGFLVVLFSSIQAVCPHCAGRHQDASPTAMGTASTDGVAMLPDAGGGDPCDPDGCGSCHCNCIASSAIIADPTLVLPAPLISRNVPPSAPERMPNGLSFAPDPAPDRA